MWKLTFIVVQIDDEVCSLYEGAAIETDHTACFVEE